MSLPKSAASQLNSCLNFGGVGGGVASSLGNQFEEPASCPPQLMQQALQPLKPSEVGWSPWKELHGLGPQKGHQGRGWEIV